MRNALIWRFLLLAFPEKTVSGAAHSAAMICSVSESTQADEEKRKSNAAKGVSFAIVKRKKKGSLMNGAKGKLGALNKEPWNQAMNTKYRNSIPPL